MPHLLTTFTVVHALSVYDMRIPLPEQKSFQITIYKKIRRINNYILKDDLITMTEKVQPIGTYANNYQKKNLDVLTDGQTDKQDERRTDRNTQT